MSGKRIAPFVAIAVAVLIAGLFVVFARSSPAEDSAQTPLMGRAAPDATGDTLDGSWFVGSPGTELEFAL